MTLRVLEVAYSHCNESQRLARTYIGDLFQVNPPRPDCKRPSAFIRFPRRHQKRNAISFLRGEWPKISMKSCNRMKHVLYNRNFGKGAAQTHAPTAGQVRSIGRSAEPQPYITRGAHITQMYIQWWSAVHRTPVHLCVRMLDVCLCVRAADVVFIYYYTPSSEHYKAHYTTNYICGAAAAQRQMKQKPS